MVKTSSSAPGLGWRALRRLGTFAGIVLTLVALGLYTYYAGTLIQILRHL
jgi:hypothetical protein